MPKKQFQENVRQDSLGLQKFEKIVLNINIATRLAIFIYRKLEIYAKLLVYLQVNYKNNKKKSVRTHKNPREEFQIHINVTSTHHPREADF